MHRQEPGDKISGEHLIVKCRTPGKWKMFRMSAQHNGWRVSAKKNATAVIEQGFKHVEQRRSKR